MRRTEQKLQSRNEIMAAAMNCFDANGFGNTNIADITAAAGVAKGSFYTHFKTKEALLDSQLAGFNRGLVTTLDATDLPDPLEERIYAIAMVFLSYWDDHSIFVRAYAERANFGLGVDAFASGINPEAQMRIGAEVARLMQVASITIDHPALVIQGLLALWARLGLQHVINHADRHAVATTLTSMTIGAVTYRPIASKNKSKEN